MTNTNKKNKQPRTWACYYDDAAELDILPPERTPTDDELEIEALLANDKQQRAYEKAMGLN